MTTSNTLSLERLGELARAFSQIEDFDQWQFIGTDACTAAEIRTLIGMAMRAEQAERERDALRDAPGISLSDVEAMFGFSCDWGDCDDQGVGVRYHHEGRSFLPVCRRHIGLSEPGIGRIALAETDAGGDAS